MSDDKELGFATKAIHAGQRPDPATGAVMTPVYFTSTYVQQAPGVHKGYDYARTVHPTRSALEANLAALEGARRGLCFSSGMAAIATVVQTLRSGDHVVCCEDLYGGTYRLFTQVFQRFGLSFSFVDAADLSAVEKAFSAQTKLLWIETPSNPMLRITDLRGACQLAHRHGALAAVDNTFASPALQRPLALGADLVVHSTTKYLGGHSDVVGGCVLANDEGLYERLKFLQNAVGAVPGPMDCFLLLRGTKTLPVRMERHCQNALAVAKHLLAHPEVERVHYPGLAHHPGHETAKAQMSGFGGMISFELKGDLSRAKRMASGTKLFCLAESLGGVESLIGHPATMTHGSIPREQRLKSGLVDGLIRLSVGLEDAADLVADLDAAIAASL
ncbi:MAG: cystathionine gamma-synthase [Elusimicrobia bacterium]|nr:cystathionine gamma-synthase [Elusimicrobiota bacterium]MDE2237409.1 cystathionine gamma-synthase [Elusimicrobiota bacterium]MDE2426565.1 cystathionine gamma-synthase [Elusimicrobiota bacterium]